MPTQVVVSDEYRLEFEDAVSTETRRLFGLALSVLRNPSEAEEAVQETFVKAWRRWETLRDSDRRQAWLTRICVNECISRRRGKFARLLRLAEPPSESLADTSQHADLDRVDPDLDRAMRLLTPSQRTVLALHYQYGYTLDECAGLMRCRPGTVRSHLNRALTRLREELRHE